MTPHLLVDAGNTRVKWTLFEDGRLGEVAAADSAGSLADALRGRWSALPTPAGVFVSSVLGARSDAEIEEVCLSLWDLPCEFARARSSALGRSSGYRDPASLGVDRWLAMLAAWHSRRAGCCVADCGSAVTIDVIDDGGRHLGGLIVPGTRLMQESLRRGTSIPAFRPTSAGAPLGRDTAEAVASGSLHAIAGAIERALAAASAATGRSPALIVTGGDGPVVADVLAVSCESRPALVLEGLALSALESLR
jgi:type III pantothenate kinase